MRALGSEAVSGLVLVTQHGGARAGGAGHEVLGAGEEEPLHASGERCERRVDQEWDRRLGTDVQGSSAVPGMENPLCDSSLGWLEGTTQEGRLVGRRLRWIGRGSTLVLTRFSLPPYLALGTRAWTRGARVSPLGRGSTVLSKPAGWAPPPTQLQEHIRRRC